jgi:hypothetical protein
MVTPENWTYCRFKSENFSAFISFGASPESLIEEAFEYFVTVIENDERETFQRQFPSLASACLYLNSQYGDWSFDDQTIKKSGCSTCAAH